MPPKGYRSSSDKPVIQVQAKKLVQDLLGGGSRSAPKEIAITAGDLRIGDKTPDGTIAQFGIQAYGTQMVYVRMDNGKWKKYRRTTKLKVVRPAEVTLPIAPPLLG